MNRELPWILFLFCIFSSIGCNKEQAVCTTPLKPAVEVAIRDAITNEPVAHGVFGILFEGAYVDTFQLTGFAGSSVDSTAELILSAGYERAGTYSIVLEKEGYQLLTASEVEVQENECGPVTRKIAAKLLPLTR